jgi:hypothetical protein
VKESLRISSRNTLVALTAGLGGLSLVACESDAHHTETAPSVSASTTGQQTVPTKPASPDSKKLGNDVSFPQCGQQLPEVQSFVVVGVNGQLPNAMNPCFSQEFSWAKQAKGNTDMPKASVYSTAANPGDQHVGDWPNTGANKYGTCEGADDQACAYEFGKFLVDLDVKHISPETPKGMKWLIDVEAEYSWESNQAHNRAELEGMAETLKQKGADVGIYSSAAAWSHIAGEVPHTSSLHGLDVWMLGGHSEQEATALCNETAFTGGSIVLAQFVTSGIDADVAC